ncbi:hypothetical protein SKAU_G00295110 [Synaphobranchus kaupii]|uniref:C2H2-type domain-containing protein n=1 Tax=Synaphobranchus kaupii TaxID=118154 RepID=A0A9Q1EUM2_SYNKA|nr:hypothetical protein SKAU_G00295110 [Synaphobranchus kaupii]
MSTCVTLHLQTQVASIMEVLAKSAVVEIGKAIDEGTAVFLLEMSRSKKENETLKWRLLELEKELLEARRGWGNGATARDRIRSVKVQVGDEIRGPDSNSYEEERSLSIDSVFGKEWSIDLWKNGELAAKKEEEAPLQPVINEEATQTVEDRQDLFPIKMELFEENLEDSDPQGGLKISAQQHIYQEGNFYSCAARQKSFTNNQHLCNRTGKKLHRCLVCGKCFSHRGSLHLHRRTVHTGEKPYSCAVCGKNFSHKGNLQKHQVIHTGEKSYSCAECGKHFSQKGNLQRHQIIHTGVKPYKCLECGKSFTDQGYLKKHILIHRGVKPHRCRECGKCFSQKSNRNSHERIHRREDTRGVPEAEIRKGTDSGLETDIFLSEVASSYSDAGNN